MNKGFVYFSAMMLYSGVSLAQVIDLGIEEKPLEPTKEENKVSLPEASSLPEIKDMRPKESTPEQTEKSQPSAENKEEKGLFSLISKRPVSPI